VTSIQNITNWRYRGIRMANPGQIRADYSLYNMCNVQQWSIHAGFPSKLNNHPSRGVRRRRREEEEDEEEVEEAGRGRGSRIFLFPLFIMLYHHLPP